MPKKATRKFGKKRYTLVWDSKTFNAPDTKAAIKEKKAIAKLYAKDCQDRGYSVKITSSGKNFKVWRLPLEN